MILPLVFTNVYTYGAMLNKKKGIFCMNYSSYWYATLVYTPTPQLWLHTPHLSIANFL